VRPFKGIFWDDISEFESSHPSQPVSSLWHMSGSQEFVRHSRELCRRRRVSVPGIDHNVGLDRRRSIVREDHCCDDHIAAVVEDA
jgi:hypothetical protein